MDKHERKSLRKVTGKWLKQVYDELVEQNCGCAHIPFLATAHHWVCVCVGWMDDGTPTGSIAWKIGWQTFDNAMQTDLDIDFDMPWNTAAYCEKMNARLTAEERKRGDRYLEGEVYDTESEITLKPGRTTPIGYRDWNALAAHIRKTAREVAAYAKEVDPEEEQ